MSATPAASESAIPSGDLSGVSPGEIGPGMGESTVLGTMDELLEAIGLPEDESGDTGETAAAKPKAEAKPEKAKAEEPAADPDYEAIKAINKRSAERRRARIAAEAARAQPAPVAAAQAPAKVDPPKAAEPAKVEPKLTGPEAEAAAAAKQVLGLIAQLAGDDAAAAATTAETTGKEAAKAAEDRTALVAEIKAKLEEIGAATKENAEIKAELQGLKTQLGAIESARIVREHIETKVEPIVADLPLLMGKRNATDIIHTAVGKFFDKYGKLPDVPELARRIEKKLAEANPPEKTEKPRSSPRKTVSSSLGSPPAARTGPDTRTKGEVEADLFKSLGIED